MKTWLLRIIFIVTVVIFMLSPGRGLGANMAWQMAQRVKPGTKVPGTISAGNDNSQVNGYPFYPPNDINWRSVDKTSSTEWFLETSGTIEHLYGIHFINKELGWIVGNSGTILYTSNGGVNWSPQTSGVSEDLRDVYFTDSLTGWIVGLSGTILHTTDGGETWTSQASPTAENLDALDFVDNLHGWIVGDNSTILNTDDGGKIWNPQDPQEGFTFFYSASVDFWDQTSGWLAPWGGGLRGGILSTTDGGLTWVQQPTNEIYYMTGVSFINALRGWASGYDVYRDPSCPSPYQASTKLFQTSDGGINWTEIGSMCGWPPAIDFINQTLGWLIVEDVTNAPLSLNHIFTTSNGGGNWSEQYNTEISLHNLFMVDANNGWAVGNNGTILHYESNHLYIPYLEK